MAVQITESRVPDPVYLLMLASRLTELTVETRALIEHELSKSNTETDNDTYIDSR